MPDTALRSIYRNPNCRWSYVLAGAMLLSLLLAPPGLVRGQSMPSAGSMPASAPADADNSAAGGGALASQPSTSTSEPTTAESQPTTARQPDAVTEEILQARLQHLQQAAGLDPQVKEQALGLYQKALDEWKAQQEFVARRDAYDAAEKDLPATLAALNAQFATALPEPKAELPPEAPLAACEARLNAAQTELSAAKRDYAALEKLPQQRADRKQEIAQILTDGRKNLDAVREQIAASPPAGENPELSLARKTFLQTHEQLLRKQLSACRRETRSYDSGSSLLAVQRDLAARRRARAQRLVDLWQDLLKQRRSASAEQMAQKAAELAQDQGAISVPAIKALAEENAALAQRRVGPEGLTAKLERVSEEYDQLTATLERVRTSHSNLVDRAKAAGNNNSIGILLRRQRANLREMQRQQEQLPSQQEEISAVQLTLIDSEDQRSQLSDLDLRMREIMSTVPPEADRASLEKTVAQLLANRRDCLDSLIGDCNTYLTKLMDVDRRRGELLREVREYQKFVDERVLWIPSAPPVGRADLAPAWAALQAFARGGAWRDSGEALWRDAQSHAPFALFGGVLFAALVVTRGAVGVRVGRIGQAVVSHKAFSFGQTLQVFLLTLFLTLWLPALVWLIGWRLESYPGRSEATGGIAAGFQAVAAALLIIGILLQVCRRHGLAEAHFLWPARSLQSLRRALWWLLAGALPLCFVLAWVEAQSDEAAKNSLGRIVFIAAMVILAAFLQKVLNPQGRVMGAARARLRGLWLGRLPGVLYVAGMALPLLLAAGAAVGYYYTSLQLAWRLQATVWLALALVLLNAVLQRWLAVTRQTLALRSSRRRASARAGEDAKAVEPKDAVPAEKATDAAANDARSRQLVRFLVVGAFVLGTWMIWSDVVPALNAVGRTEIWNHVVKVTPGADGLAEKVVPVTLGDLVLAAIVAVLAFVVGKDIPGMLEMTVLAALKWNVGARYAFTTISRYAITVVGCIIILGLLGISWSGIQWLVAAITVGLGFGLQEIFANFVSGLIVLFERPIRVGDIVTVGDVSGTVTRIRIRATTITDFDRKELIVPNKQFITGQLVNWTLSDTVLRVVVPVRIATGSDTAKARHLLLRTAKANRIVMDKPAPEAYFLEFVNGALVMELRVFVRNLADFHRARHELHVAVENAFRDAGIVMA